MESALGVSSPNIWGISNEVIEEAEYHNKIAEELYEAWKKETDQF